jgi:uncharacterized cupin superfamily protein
VAAAVSASLPKANVLRDPCELDGDEPEGFATGALRLSAAIGAGALAVKAFELAAGQSICPYHYEFEEEWLLVLSGTVRVRTPGGEEPLQNGDIVCFPPGAAGAHRVENADAGPARVLMFSSAREPAVAFYPDSGKVGVWPGGEEAPLMFRAVDGGLDYWEGERGD